MSKQTFFAINVDGKPKIAKNHDLKEFMRSFGDKEYQITVEKRIRKRSNLQNGFYWNNVIQSQIDCFKEYWGESYTPKQIHDWNKAKFWADTAVVGDEVVTKPATSTKYSTVEWEERVDLIRTFFLNTFDWDIGYPEKQTEIF